MYKILIIDDSKVLRDMLWDCLSGEGFKVITAADGNEGINLVGQFRPDLVITDIIMPEKDGIEVTMYLKQYHPDIRIIAMSSGGTISAQNHLSIISKLGADYVLVKPFNKEGILEAISSVRDLVYA